MKPICTQSGACLFLLATFKEQVNFKYDKYKL